MSEDERKPPKVGEFHSYKDIKREVKNVLDSSNNSAGQSRDMSPISSSFHVFHTEVAKVASESSSYHKKLSLASGESKRG